MHFKSGSVRLGVRMHPRVQDRSKVSRDRGGERACLGRVHKLGRKRLINLELLQITRLYKNYDVLEDKEWVLKALV